MDFASFEAERRKGKPPAPVTVFAGPEALLRERGVALLAKSDPELGANALRVAASETEWSRLADELYTPPFFAKRKLVVLVDDGKFVQANTGSIRNYLDDPSPSSVLAVLAASLKLPRLGAAPVVECRSLKPADLRRWVTQEARALGKTLARDAADHLASRGGPDLAALAGHLEKLALHAGKRAAITLQDVQALVVGRVERKVYELSLAAASKNGPKAFRVLRDLLSAGEVAPKVLGMLAWEYRRLANAKRLMGAGRSGGEVASMLRVSYFKEEFLRTVERHEMGELVKKHGEILKADVALKTSGGAEEAILESLVLRLARSA